MPELLFDDALPKLVEILRDARGPQFVEQGVVLRDATGRLTFYAADQRVQQVSAAPSVVTTDPNFAPGQSEGQESPSDPLERELADALGAYANRHQCLVYAGELGSRSVLTSNERIPLRVSDVFCQLIDRRIVGAGWLADPAPSLLYPPRIVLASLKGGVGRSTALTVLAADLARRNRNVLVIDLDLEAPGLGHLMLDADRLPELGVIDFLVENGVGRIATDRLSAFVGTSRLTDAGGGRVDVMPATGSKSVAFPENILPKLARAMIEDIEEDETITVAQQVSRMIDRIVAQAAYDVVLIDSRAGLAELAAPAVTGLGATVLLFGTAQSQTIEGYRALFAALQLLAQRDRAKGFGAEWRTSLRPVYAKASLNVDVERRFKDDLYELFSEYLYDAEIDDAGAGAMNSLESLIFTRNDPAAPHNPLIIPFNPAFVDFDPTRVPGQLTASFYEQSFRPFLNAIDTILDAALPMQPSQ